MCVMLSLFRNHIPTCPTAMYMIDTPRIHHSTLSRMTIIAHTNMTTPALRFISSMAMPGLCQAWVSLIGQHAYRLSDFQNAFHSERFSSLTRVDVWAAAGPAPEKPEENHKKANSTLFHTHVDIHLSSRSSEI